MPRKLQPNLPLSKAPPAVRPLCEKIVPVDAVCSDKRQATHISVDRLPLNLMGQPEHPATQALPTEFPARDSPYQYAAKLGSRQRLSLIEDRLLP